MRETNQQRIRDEAIGWHIRLANASEEDWQEFTDWLESVSQHNQAYEMVADEDMSLDHVMAEHSAAPVAANDDSDEHDASGRSAFRQWAAIAATVLLIGGGGYLYMYRTPVDQAYATLPGETRVVELDDGSRIALNGGTRLIVEGDNPRHVELEKGEARFAVQHDAADSFTVSMGQHRVVDIGTVFDIVHEGGLVRVGVAKGKVRYEGFAKSVAMRAGDILVATADGKLAKARALPASIGSWSRGELVYREAPLDRVAADLARSAGVGIGLAPGLSNRKFSGVIQTQGERMALRKRIEAVLGVRVTETDDGWVFEP